jgi:hypothetical protein
MLSIRTTEFRESTETVYTYARCLYPEHQYIGFKFRIIDCKKNPTLLGSTIRVVDFNHTTTMKYYQCTGENRPAIRSKTNYQMPCVVNLKSMKYVDLDMAEKRNTLYRKISSSSYSKSKIRTEVFEKSSSWL